MRVPWLEGAIALLLLAPSTAMAGEHFANADDNTAVLQGKGLYARQCAACHGRSLEGQPLWQVQDQYAHRRAPAHNASGHTWQHSDEDLFYMTKYGRFPGVTAASYVG